ncbi:MAG: hypothetical protein JSW60_09500 [Thermoplasmatales archaeon]|nr:MAG: hypothetical protein JSW60_09500 [Thermoplasmatales archaeon]
MKKYLAVAVILLFISVSVIPSISGNINESRNVEIVDNVEHSPLQVTFTRPENGIYCFDKKILPFPVPLILCRNVTVEAEVEPMSEVVRIVIFINYRHHETIESPSPDYKFVYSWGGPPFSKVSFGIEAYGHNGTYANDEIIIRRIFR